MSEQDNGGLMYQQLRKFINVIVSLLSISNLTTFYRMNCAMWVYNSILNCQELQCLVGNQLVNLLSWNPLSDWTAYQELTVSAPGVLWSWDSITLPKSASLGLSSTRSRRSSQTLLRSNLQLSILQTKFAARARTSSISLLCLRFTLTLARI